MDVSWKNLFDASFRQLNAVHRFVKGMGTEIKMVIEASGTKTSN